MARVLGRSLWCLAARVARVIRVDALWLSVAPLDMRAGMDTLLAQVVQVFGARQDSCRLIHAAICCLFPTATTAPLSGLRVTAMMGDQSRVCPVQRAG